jgi:hypothetical protein
MQKPPNWHTNLPLSASRTPSRRPWSATMASTMSSRCLMAAGSTRGALSQDCIVSITTEPSGQHISDWQLQIGSLVSTCVAHVQSGQHVSCMSGLGLMTGPVIHRCKQVGVAVSTERSKCTPAQIPSLIIKASVAAGTINATGSQRRAPEGKALLSSKCTSLEATAIKATSSTCDHNSDSARAGVP